MTKRIMRLLAYVESALNKVLRLVDLDKYTYDYHIKKNSKEYNQNTVLMNNSWKSVKRMEDEMLSLRNYWHYPPEYQYIRYKLYEKDLDKEELLDYIPPFYIYRRYNPRIYKNVDKRLFSDKLYLFNYFTKLGIKTPEVLLKVSGGGYYLISGKQIKESELALVLDEGYYFVKPTDGMGGNGIFTITISDGSIKCDNKPVKQLPIDINRNYIIQKALVQRPDIAAINSSSINTLRIVTQNFHSQPKICACVMRIGRNGSFVDNSAQGGLSIKIDVETGMMNDYAVGEHVDGNYYKHPDSAFIFKGYKITGWDKIKESLLDYVSRVRDIPEIAWDVAVVEDGIEIVEMNINYGIDHLQTSCGGMRRALGIYPNLKK